MSDNYTIKQGDTYWGLSKKLYGTGTAYPQILKVNNLSEDDVLHPGAIIKLPKVMTKKDIPTKNVVHVIDNFSKKFDYIVEGNKVYKSVKGKDKYFDISDDIGAQKHLLKFLNDKYQFRGYNDGEYRIYQNLLNGTSNQNTVEVLPTKLVARQDNTRVNKPMLPIKDENTKVVIDLNSANTNNVTTPAPEDNPSIWDKIKGIFSRGYSKYIDNGESDEQSKIELPTNEKLEGYSIIPGTITGDTIVDRRYSKPTSAQVYYLPENINLGDVILGSRIRGNYTPIKNTSGAVITLVNDYITRYEDRDPNKISPKWYFIGYDKNGKFKHGNFKDFSTGDTMVRVAVNDFLGFVHDTNGNIVTKQARGNRGYVSPQVYYLENGQKKVGALNLLVNGSANGLSRYGSVQGGRVLALVGNESRVISGSVKDIEKSLLELQNRYPGQTIKLATMDNGTYNTGLRTKNHILSAQDLRTYDSRNRGGGNFFYIIDKPEYSQSYQQTPNVRTTESDSYKKGHPLQNTDQGIVFHHTAMTDPTLNRVSEGFMNPRTERSSHVAIGYNGERIQFANPEQVTFHAGYSRFNGTPDANDFMLGIEFQGRTDQKPLTDEQINSAIEWMTPIIRKYNIPLQNLTTHKRIRDEYNLHQRQNLIKKYHIPERKLPSSLSMTDEYKKVLDKYNVAQADRPTQGKDVDIVEPEYARLMEAVKKRLYYPTPKKQSGGRLVPKNLLGNPLLPTYQFWTYQLAKLAVSSRERKKLIDRLRDSLDKSANTTSVGDEYHGYPQTISIFDLSEHPEANEDSVGLKRKETDRTGDKINYDKPGSIHGKGIVRALAAIDANKTTLKRIYGLTDEEFDYYRSWVPAVMKTETSGGDSAKGDQKAPNYNWYNFESGRAGTIMYNPGLKGGTWEGSLKRPFKNFLGNLAFNPRFSRFSESLGLGNVKVASEFTPKERKARGYDYIFKNKDLREGAEASGLVTMEALIRKGQEFKKDIKPILIKKGINDKNVFNAMFITGYNQGYNNILTNAQNYNPDEKGSWERNILPYVGDQSDYTNKNRAKGTSYYENTNYLRSLTDWQPSKITDYQMNGSILPEVEVTAPKIDRFPYVWNYENTDYSKGLTDWQMNHNIFPLPNN